MDMDGIDWGRKHKGNFSGNGNILCLGWGIGLMCICIYQNSSDFTLHIWSLYINFTLISINECIWVWSQAGKTKWKQLHLFYFSSIWNSKKYIIDSNIFSPPSVYTYLQFQVVDQDYFYSNNFSPWNVKKGKNDTISQFYKHNKSKGRAANYGLCFH